MASMPSAKENSPGAAAVAASAATRATAQLTAAILAGFEELTEDAVSAGAGWAAGHISNAIMPEKRASLAGALQKLAPVHHLIDVAQLETELKAFTHTADMAAYVATTLRKKTEDPPITDAFFALHAEVHSFAIAHVLLYLL